MDPVTYEKLNHLLLKDGSMTIDQFRLSLSQELGEEAPLVRQLADWNKTDYQPGQLLSLTSVLRDEVTIRTPRFSTIEETMRLIDDDINERITLRTLAYDLFAVQRLYKWVIEYEKYYTLATQTN